MVRRAKHLNRAVTQLNGAITDAATSITVDDGSVFPTEGDFTIAIDNEIMKVTARSTNTLTVIRSVESTTAVAHDDNSYVFALLTTQQLDDWRDDIVGTQYSTNRSDYPARLFDKSGNSLDSSDFSWVNQGSASVVDESSGAITIITDNASSSLNLRVLTKSAPSTPYTLTGFMNMSAPSGVGITDSVQMVGLGLRQSSTGEIAGVGIRATHTVFGVRYNSATSFAAYDGVQDFNGRQSMWFRVGNNGTTITFYASVNGTRWFTLGTTNVGAFLTPDQMCFWVHSGLNSGTSYRSGTLYSWIEE